MKYIGTIEVDIDIYALSDGSLTVAIDGRPANPVTSYEEVGKTVETVIKELRVEDFK